MPWYAIIGLLAAICIAVYMMPQLIKVIKTKDTTSISVIMVILAVVGDAFFIINGVGLMVDKGWAAGLPLFLANLFGCAISAIILFFKLRAMRWATKFNIKESDIPEHFNEIKEKIRLQRKAEADKKASGVEVPPAVPAEGQ